MRPVFKNSITSSFRNFNQNHYLNLVFGRVIKLNWLLISDFFKGSLLGFSFWYTVNLCFFYTRKWTELIPKKRPQHYTVEVSKKAVTYSPTVWQYNLR